MSDNIIINMLLLFLLQQARTEFDVEKLWCDHDLGKVFFFNSVHVRILHLNAQSRDKQSAMEIN